MMNKLSHDIERASNIKLASIGRYLPAVGGGILGGLGGVAVTNDDDSTLASILKPLLGAAIGGTMGYSMSGAPPIPPKYQVFDPDDQISMFGLKDAKYNPMEDLAEAMRNPGQRAIGYADPLEDLVDRAVKSGDFSDLDRMTAEKMGPGWKREEFPNNDPILKAFRHALATGDFAEVDRIVNEVVSRGK